MLTLALDCCADPCSVALARDRAVIASRGATSRGSAEALVSLVDEVLCAAGLSIKDVDLLAVSTGPGSYTGVRIAITLAQGLSLGTHIPVLGVPLLFARVPMLLEAKGVNGQNQLNSKGRQIVVPHVRANSSELFVSAFVVDSSGDWSNISCLGRSYCVGDGELLKFCSLVSSEQDSLLVGDVSVKALAEFDSGRLAADYIALAPERICAVDIGSRDFKLRALSNGELGGGFSRMTWQGIVEGSDTQLLRANYVKVVNAKTLAERGLG